MTDKQLQAIRNRNRQIIEHSNRFGSQSNHIRFSDTESYAHFLRKCVICWELMREGKEFYTEARMLGGGRADIVNLDDGEIIEVVVSEREESIVRKQNNYPYGFRLRIDRLAM